MKTTKESVAVTKASSSACAPVTEKSRSLHPNRASSQCNNRVATNSSGMATKGTTQSDDLR